MKQRGDVKTMYILELNRSGGEAIYRKAKEKRNGIIISKD